MSKGPDFFVVGAPKAATTSLFHYLGQHPDIFVPTMKEPHHFYPEVADTYYRAHPVLTQHEYLALYDTRRDELVAGDFSTSYLAQELAAERIVNFNAEAKIIVVLRNPIDRAMSHYRMDVRDNYTADPVEYLIGPDAPDPRFRWQYIAAGMYCDQIAAYRARFAEEQILIVLFDDLMLDASATVRDIFAFLGVDSGVAIDVSDVRNSTRHVSLGGLSKVTRSPLAKMVVSLLGPKAAETVRKLMQRSGSAGPAEFPPVLAEIFEAEIRRLETMIKRDLGHWLETGV